MKIMMNSQASEASYLCSLGGILKVTQETLNFFILIGLVIVGAHPKGNGIFYVTISNAIVSALLLLMNLMKPNSYSCVPLIWIEFTYVLCCALAISITSTIAIIIYTKGFIIIAVMGYCNSAVYLFDTLRTYRLAMKRRKELHETTPNMPASI